MLALYSISKSPWWVSVLGIIILLVGIVYVEIQNRRGWRPWRKE
jgi:membrane protein YdbS with pleckstrin-like domain